MPFRNPSLHPTEIQSPTRLQRSSGERALLRKLRIRMLKRALWKIGGVLVYAVAIAVIAPLWREHRVALVAGSGVTEVTAMCSSFDELLDEIIEFRDDKFPDPICRLEARLSFVERFIERLLLALAQKHTEKNAPSYCGAAVI
jgi:hypothetical protein